MQSVLVYQIKFNNLISENISAAAIKSIRRSKGKIKRRQCHRELVVSIKENATLAASSFVKVPSLNNMRKEKEVERKQNPINMDGLKKTRAVGPPTVQDLPKEPDGASVEHA